MDLRGDKMKNWDAHIVWNWRHIGDIIKHNINSHLKRIVDDAELVSHDSC